MQKVSDQASPRWDAVPYENSSSQSDKSDSKFDLVLKSMTGLFVSKDGKKQQILAEIRPNDLFRDSRPYTRWWWLKGPFRKADITSQLEWVKEQGFGGTEIAWLRPDWLNRIEGPEIPAGLSCLEQTLFVAVKIKHAVRFLKKSLDQSCPIPSCRQTDCFETTNENTKWNCIKCHKEGDVVDLVASVQEKPRSAAAAWLAKKAKIKANPKDPPQAKLPWLGEKFSEYLAFTKKESERLGLGCDFTFGSVWPFGGQFLRPEHQGQTFFGPSIQRIPNSWEGGKVPVLNHLLRQALDEYANVLGPAFQQGLKGRPSALFCDSLELEKQNLWDPHLWDLFSQKFGYNLRDHLQSNDSSKNESPFERLHHAFGTDPHLRYDVRKFVGITLLKNFYEHFTEVSHRLGALSRVQCHGAPTDLLAAYATADVPESESLLFNPWFSKIAASAGCLADRSVVSCETFTCIYGFPDNRHKEESISDLKFLADALIANGINQIVWHGMPYNPPGSNTTFFASVHVGPDCAFRADLKAFNSYLSTVSAYMRLGQTISKLAVYLPNEDMMMLGDLPREMKTAGASDFWEMRHVQMPAETEGYAPLWISGKFLSEAQIEKGLLAYQKSRFSALYIDVQWLDGEILEHVLRLARQGLPIILKQCPRQPGKAHFPSYSSQLDELYKLPNVHKTLQDTSLAPLVQGKSLPYYWVRAHKGDLFYFFAHPETRNICDRLKHAQSKDAKAVEQNLRISSPRGWQDIKLRFGPNESLLLKVSQTGKIEVLDLGFDAAHKNVE